MIDFSEFIGGWLIDYVAVGSDIPREDVIPGWAGLEDDSKVSAVIGPVDIPGIKHTHAVREDTPDGDLAEYRTGDYECDIALTWFGPGAWSAMQRFAVWRGTSQAVEMVERIGIAPRWLPDTSYVTGSPVWHADAQGKVWEYRAHHRRGRWPDIRAIGVAAGWHPVGGRTAQSVWASRICGPAAGPIADGLTAQEVGEATMRMSVSATVLTVYTGISRVKIDAQRRRGHSYHRGCLSALTLIH